MHERERPTPELLLWRIERLERERESDLAVEKAMQWEIHERATYEHLRSDYYSRAEVRNVFVTREELEREASVRRELRLSWPLVIFGAITVGTQIVNLVVLLKGGR